MGKQEDTFIGRRFETNKPSFLESGHLITPVQARGQKPNRLVSESKAAMCHLKSQQHSDSIFGDLMESSFVTSLRSLPQLICLIS